MIELQRFRQYF